MSPPVTEVSMCARGLCQGAWDRAFVTSYYHAMHTVVGIVGGEYVSDATKGPKWFRNLQGGEGGIEKRSPSFPIPEPALAFLVELTVFEPIVLRT